MPKRIQSWSERHLATQIPAPNGTPIGRRLQELVPAGAVKLKHTDDSYPGATFTRTTDTFDFNRDGKADARLETDSRVGPNGAVTVDFQMLQILKPGTERSQTYFARASGRVDSFYDGDAKSYTVTRDTDEDGRVDEILKVGSDMGPVSFDGHSGTPLDEKTFVPLSLDRDTASKAIQSHMLKDNDKDGSFDTESIGGPWWVKDD